MLVHRMLKAIKFGSLNIAILFASACSTTARLYPVQGPSSEMKPPPVINAKVSGIMGNNGKMTFSLPDGIPCKGEWSSAAGSGVSFASGSLIGQYGAAHLSGFSISPGQGQNPGSAITLCDDGTRFEIEFITGAGTANGFGIAKDNKGNVYKLLF